MSDLIKRLAKSSQPVAAVRYESDAEFEEAIERGFVLIKFTETQGGTELGFKIDDEKSEIKSSKSKKIRLVGGLVLDYVPVECDVTLDRKTRQGTGILKMISND